MMPEERRNPMVAGNAISTLVNHPDLTRSYLTFSFYLLYALDVAAPRLRELAVPADRPSHLLLPTSGTNTSRSARTKACPTLDIAALQRGEAADDFDRTVLTAVDELVETTRITDETWAALGERMDKRQLMDFVFTVGGYHMLAMALNTFGVEPAGLASHLASNKEN